MSGGLLLNQAKANESRRVKTSTDSKGGMGGRTCTRETAAQKVRLAEDAWNTREPERVSLAYTVDSVWRNRAEFLSGREMIVQFLRRK